MKHHSNVEPLSWEAIGLIIMFAIAAFLIGEMWR